MAPGQTITVYVSTGQQTSAMPNITGKSSTDAEAALKAVGLQLGAVTTRSDPDLAQGIVISADQTVGTQIPVGTRVNLTVASGKVALVNLVGYTVDAATRDLTSADLKLTASVVEDPSCPAVGSTPIVAGQSLPPGDVPIHSTVELRVCTGK